MGLFEHFPYTNFHDLNLDKIVENTKEAKAAAAAAEAAALAAAADASVADTKATNAFNLANTAKGIADQAVLDAAAAQHTADQAILDAASAATAAANGPTPTFVNYDDLINTDNTNVSLYNNSHAVKVGKLLFFTIYAYDIGVDHRLIYFKTPYNNLINISTEIIEKSNSSAPYDTFKQMILNLGTSIGPTITLTNYTSSEDVMIKGIAYLA